jgi:hypothetical protein
VVEGFIELRGNIADSGGGRGCRAEGDSQGGRGLYSQRSVVDQAEFVFIPRFSGIMACVLYCFQSLTAAAPGRAINPVGHLLLLVKNRFIFGPQIPV